MSGALPALLQLMVVASGGAVMFAGAAGLSALFEAGLREFIAANGGDESAF